MPFDHPKTPDAAHLPPVWVALVVAVGVALAVWGMTHP